MTQQNEMKLIEPGSEPGSEPGPETSPETGLHTGRQTSLEIGIDIGGTFTDFVVYNPHSCTIDTFKLLSTPGDPAQAVLDGLEQILNRQVNAQHPFRLNIIHGSTVATNALLERRGARTAFIATAGFGDLLQIGRQNRPVLYDLFADPAPTLVPEELRFEIAERVDCHGKVVTALDPEQVEAMMNKLAQANVESAAVCLLFSFLHPEHEKAIAEKLRQNGIPVSISCEILAEFREYERASTTTVNAYVSPVLDRYLTHLEEAVQKLDQTARLRVMQSNGGSMSVQEVRQGGVHCILSGPAGGVVGAGCIAALSKDGSLSSQSTGWNWQDNQLKVISFDMGGTSTDVSLLDGKPRLTTEAVISGCPIGVPVLDIHTIGAGGGSIARVDAGGALRVGPESAGAQPGPACYGHGDFPTVTDANLVLGRIVPGYFLGGEMILDRERAWRAIAQLGEALGLDPLHTALGVVEVVNAHMERALRVISVERGYDPRLFTLLSFGGAGGLHAVDLARRLGIQRVLAPSLAATLSAFGMLNTNVIMDGSQTMMLAGDFPLAFIETSFASLVARLKENFASAFGSHSADDLVDPLIEKYVDMRYQGQSYELTIPFSKRFAEDFNLAHRTMYGFSRQDHPLELVTIRARLVAKTPPMVFPGKSQAGSDPAAALMGYTPAVLDRGSDYQTMPYYRGEGLLPGNHLVGPALVLHRDTTIFLDRSDQAHVDRYGNLHIQVSQ